MMMMVIAHHIFFIFSSIAIFFIPAFLVKMAIMVAFFFEQLIAKIAASFSRAVTVHSQLATFILLVALLILLLFTSGI